MTGMGNVFRVAMLPGVLAAGLAVANGQIQSNPRSSPGAQPSVMDASGDSRTEKVPAEMRERMEKARNDERQKRLVSDTDKLLALATSLKTDVDKTDKYTLSLDVIRRSEEIEKLAHSIRERMKQ